MSGLISDFLLSGSNLTYTQRYAYNYAIKSLTWAIFLTMISFIGQSTCEKFKSKPSTNKKTSTAKSDPLLDPCSSHDLNNIQWHLNYREIEKELKRNNNSQPILARVGIHMSSIGHFLAYMVYGSIPAILSSLGIIPVWLSCLMIFLMSLIAGCFAVKIFYTPEIRQLIAGKQCFKGKDGPEPILRRFYNQAYHIYRLYPSDVKRLAVFALCYSLCLPNLTSDSCLAYYTPEYGSVFDAYSISTSFVRFLTRSESCPSGRICHLYTTLPEDPSTSVFLNVHTGTDVDTLQVVYSSEDDLDEQHSIFSGSNKTAQSYFLNLERKARRYIHSVYLDNLQPNTPYYAQIYYKDTLLGDARFSTLPDTKMQSNITMIIGGDSSGTDKSLAFITRIADYNPDVIIIGGDIVYDNGNPNCYYCWDYYLDQFSALNNKVGRIVPLILAIGNHDIGMNNHQFLHVDKSQNLFFQFFPQHTRPNLTKPEVPDPEERMSYFYHRIGNMLHVFLDSGYLERYADHQLEWLRNISKKYPYMAKFATYHVPIFPGCFFNPLETKKYDSRFYSWISIFEKNHFMGVFENHVHLFKRTFPLTFHSNNSRSPGVVYFGDGAWGVNENDCFDRDPHPNITEVFARVGKVSHVWVVRVNKKTVEYSAINVEGEVIDEYKQNIGDYVGSKKIFKHYSGQISLPNITIDA